MESDEIICDEDPHHPERCLLSHKHILLSLQYIIISSLPSRVHFSSHSCSILRPPTSPLGQAATRHPSLISTSRLYIHRHYSNHSPRPTFTTSTCTTLTPETKRKNITNNNHPISNLNLLSYPLNAPRRHLHLSSVNYDSSMVRLVNYHSISQAVYDLASSNDPVAPLVRESLDVIEDALDSFGWAYFSIRLHSAFWRG